MVKSFTYIHIGHNHHMVAIIDMDLSTPLTKGIRSGGFIKY